MSGKRRPIEKKGFIRCSDCEELLPEESFGVHKNSPNGRRAKCKLCTNSSRRDARSVRDAKALDEQRVKNLQAEANKNAIISLIKNHDREFAHLLRQEQRRLLPDQHVQDEPQKGWVSLMSKESSAL